MAASLNRGHLALSADVYNSQLRFCVKFPLFLWITCVQGHIPGYNNCTIAIYIYKQALAQIHVCVSEQEHMSSCLCTSGMKKAPSSKVCICAPYAVVSLSFRKFNDIFLSRSV